MPYDGEGLEGEPRGSYGASVPVRDSLTERESKLSFMLVGKSLCAALVVQRRYNLGQGLVKKHIYLI